VAAYDLDPAFFNLQVNGQGSEYTHFGEDCLPRLTTGAAGEWLLTWIKIEKWLDDPEWANSHDPMFQHYVVRYAHSIDDGQDWDDSPNNLLYSREYPHTVVNSDPSLAGDATGNFIATFSSEYNRYGPTDQEWIGSDFDVADKDIITVRSPGLIPAQANLAGVVSTRPTPTPTPPPAR
jgi:hypothetical protein